MATDNASQPTSTPVALADFPLELQIQILSKRAFLHMDDMLMHMFDGKRDEVEKFYDDIRSKQGILCGPLLHSAWHGGVYDCNGWGHLRLGHSNIIVIEACEQSVLNEDCMWKFGYLTDATYDRVFKSSTYRKITRVENTLRVVTFQTAFLDESTGAKFNNIQCEKTRRVCQLLYVFNKTCRLWPLPLLSYSCLNARDEIKFGFSGTETDVRTAFQTLMNKRFWIRSTIQSGLMACPFNKSCSCAGQKHHGGSCAFLEHGYTMVSTSSRGRKLDISFETRRVSDAMSVIYVCGRFGVHVIFKALPKRIVSLLASAAGVTSSIISTFSLSDEDTYRVIWAKLCTLKRGTLYTPSLEELGPIFSKFARGSSDDIIGIFLPPPWRTAFFDTTDQDYVLLHEYIDNPCEVEAKLQSHCNSLNQMPFECFLNPASVEWGLLDENQPPLHRLMTVLKKDDEEQAMVCHCGTRCSL